MDRAIPGVGNKYLQKKWQKQKQQKEARKLKGVKSLVNIEQPTKYQHMNRGGNIKSII